MKNKRFIRKILKYLKPGVKEENDSYEVFRSNFTTIPESRLLSIMKMLIEYGLIDGFGVERTSYGDTIVVYDRLRITEEGREHLYYNSVRARLLRFFKKCIAFIVVVVVTALVNAAVSSIIN
jgi:hypothetical protein